MRGEVVGICPMSKTKIVKNIRRQVVKSSPTHGKNMKNVGKNNSKLNRVQLPSSKKHSRLSTLKLKTSNEKNIISDVLSTGAQIGKNIVDIASDPALGLLEVPSTIMKVVDTTSNIVRNVSKSDAKEKIVLQDKATLNDQANSIVFNKLKEQMPVITTTQIPSSYSTEINQAPLTVTERVSNGRKITNVSGSYALAPSYDDLTVGYKWNYSLRLTPVDPNCFGPRVESIASTFQMYRINSVTANWIPTIGTDYNGNVLLNFMDGTDTSDQYGSSIDYQTASQRDHIQPSSAKLGTSLTVKGKGDWLYVYNSVSGDPKFFTSLTFGNLTHLYVAPSSPTRMGYVMLTFDIDFMSASDASYSFFSVLSRKTHGHWVSSGVNATYMKFLAFLYHYSVIGLDFMNTIDPLKRSVKIFDGPLPIAPLKKDPVADFLYHKRTSNLIREDILNDVFNLFLTEVDPSPDMRQAFAIDKVKSYIAHLIIYHAFLLESMSDLDGLKFIFNIIKTFSRTESRRIDPIPHRYATIPDSDDESDFEVVEDHFEDN